MESSDCRRGVSDAEQSAWSYSMTVKQEPEWAETGVSDAAVAEFLYAGHEIKDELVVGPELLQQQDIAISMQNALSRAEEGPCKRNAVHGAEAAPECSRACPGEGPCCDRSTEQQHGLRSCFVRLQQLPAGVLHTSKPSHMSNDYMLSGAEEDACKLEPADGAGAAPECTRTQSHKPTRTHVHTGQKPHSCDTCHKRFTRKDRLIAHMRIHSGEKPYRCDVCHKRFTHNSTFAKHKRIHTGKKPYSCDICKKRFTNQFNLVAHMRIHTGEKPYSCNICEKRYTQKSHLVAHMRIHTGEKPYSCDICEKRYTQKSHLVAHIRIHTGEKPHSCNICGKRFVYRKNLTRHIQIHSGEKSYSCSLCDKRFTQRSNLTKHKRIHTGEKPHSCDICNKRFRRKAHLSRHMQLHSNKKL